MATKARKKKSQAKKKAKAQSTAKSTSTSKAKATSKKAGAKRRTKPKARPTKTKRRKNAMAYAVRDVGPLRLAAVVNREAPANPGAAWHAMFPLMRERGMKGQALAAFGTRDLASHAIEWYAASAVVDGGAAIDPPLEEVFVARGSYAVWTYVGPFDGLGDAWGGFTRHVANIGHVADLARPLLEIYKSDGKNSADGKPRTELCIPV